VPNNDWGKRVALRLEYEDYCNYVLFCGEDGVNAGMLKLTPPVSRMTCEKMYCMSEVKTPEMQFASTSLAYTGAQAAVELSIKNLPTADAQDLSISFGSVYGTVLGVERQSNTLSSVYVTTPHMLDSASVTAKLMVESNVAGGKQSPVSFPFSFYSKPSGDSTLTLMPVSGTEGTVVTATLTNFPITTLASDISIAVSGSVQALTPSRIISSDAISTTILFSMYAVTNGVVTVSISSVATGASLNTGSAAFTYSAIEPAIRQFYPAYGSSSGGYEMYIAMTGFPPIATPGEVSVNFGGSNAVTATTLLSSTQPESYLTATNRVKLTVPSMQLYGGMTDVTVTAGGSSAKFKFFYSPVSVATIDSVEPPSGAMQGGYPVNLHVKSFPKDSTSQDVIVMFDNIRVTGKVGILESDGSATITVMAPPFGAARNVKCEVYVAYDVMFTNTIGTFSFIYTSNSVVPNPPVMPLTGGFGTSFVVQDISWATTIDDWSVSFGGMPAVVSSVVKTLGNTTITATVPAGKASGSVMGAVMYLADRSAYDFSFTYTDPPSVTRVSPQNFGPTSGGTVLTVCLKDFPVVYDSSLLSVTFGTSKSQALVLSSSVAETIIQVATPASSAGRAAVSIVFSTYTAKFDFDYKIAGYSIDLVYPMGAMSTQLSSIYCNIRGFSLSKASSPKHFTVRVGNMYGYVGSVQVMNIAEGTASIMAYLPSMPVGIYRVSVMQGSEMAVFDDLFVVSSGYGRVMNVSATDAAAGTGTTQVTIYNFPVRSNLDVMAKYGDIIASISSFYTDDTGAVTVTIVNPTDPMLRGSVAAPLQLFFPTMSMLTTAGSDCPQTTGTTSCSALYASPFRLNAAPGFSSLQFDAGRSAVRIVFDQKTNKASITDPSITDCGQVIAGSSFGAGSRCIWEDESTYVINLGSAAVLSTASPLKVVAGKVRAASGNSMDSKVSSGLGYSCLSNPAPLIMINMPSEIGPCADLPLSAAGTTPGANYEYMWSCTNDAMLNEALSLVNAAEASVSGTNLVVSGKTYNLRLSVKVGGILYGSAAHSITKRPLPVPTLTVQGERVYVQGEIIKLDAVAAFSGCPTTTGNLIYDWIYDGKSVSTSTQYSTVATEAWVVGLSGGDIHTGGIASAATEGKTLVVNVYVTGDGSIVASESVDVFVISKNSVLRAPIMTTGLGIHSAGQYTLDAMCDYGDSCVATCAVAATGVPCSTSQWKEGLEIKTGEPVELRKDSTKTGPKLITVSAMYGPVLKSSVQIATNPDVTTKLVLDLMPGHGVRMSENNRMYVTTGDRDFSFVASLSNTQGQYVAANNMLSWKLTYGSTQLSTGTGTGAGMEMVIPFGEKTLTAGNTYQLTVHYKPDETIFRTVDIMVSSPPTRGSCSLSAVTTTTSSPIIVTCSNFAGAVSRVAGMLSYEYGYVFTKNKAGNVMTNQEMVFFASSTSSSSPLCLPAGTLNIVVRVTNAAGASTYNTAGSVVVTTDVAYLLTAQAESIETFGRVGDGTVAAAFQAYGQLPRLDLLTQCAYVYASGGRSSVAGVENDMDALITYTTNGARHLGQTADASMGISTLRAMSAYTQLTSPTTVVLATTSYSGLATTTLAAAQALNDNGFISATNATYTADTVSGVARAFNASDTYTTTLAVSPIIATAMTEAIDWTAMFVSYWQSTSPAMTDAFGFVGARIGASTTFSSSNIAVPATVGATMRNYMSPVTPKPRIKDLTLDAVTWNTLPILNTGTEMNKTTPVSLAWMYSNLAASSPFANTRIQRDPINWNPNHKKISSVYGVSINTPKTLLTAFSDVAGKFTVKIPLDTASLTTAQNATLAMSVSCTMLSPNTGIWKRSDVDDPTTCQVQSLLNNVTLECSCPLVAADVLAEYVLVKGCDGVFGSGKVNDCSGTCDGTVRYDACGVCAGTNSTCNGCDGIPNSGKINDLCGKCDGDGSTCKGCDGVHNSGLDFDACGICGGDGTTCKGCDGLPNGKTYDQCGVCGGNASTCSGCDLVPYSGKKFDKCMICGGNSNVSYDKTCMGRIITSTTDTTDLVVMTGMNLTKFFKAKASDNGNYLDMVNFTEVLNPLSSLSSFSYILPEFSSKQVGENVTGTLKWTPKKSGNFRVCLDLKSYLTSLTIQTECFTVYSVFCEHVAKTDQTLDNIAALYLTSWRTLWWLNPNIESSSQRLIEGTRVKIGRTYTMPRNTTLATITNLFDTTYDQLMKYNPLKINYLQGGLKYYAETSQILGYRMADKPVIDLQYMDYGNQIEYAGMEFCLKSGISPM
jgi:hypothetical protein